MHVICAFDGVKGAPKIHTYNTCKHLVKLGHTVDLITTVPPEEFKNIGVKIIKVKDINLKESILKTILKNTFFTLNSLFRTCDIFYTRNCLLASLFKLLRPTTSVACEVNGLRYVELPISGCKNTVRIKIVAFLEIKLMPFLVDAVIVVTKGLGDTMVKGGAPKNKIFLVRNGVNHQLFKPIRDQKSIRALYGISENETVIIFVGKVCAWHGVEHTFGIFARVLMEKKNVKLFFVGDKKEELDTKLRMMIDELSLTENIIFTGWMDNKDVSDCIMAADAGIHTGMHGYELNPFKVLEYMAAGKPVIGSKFGLEELIAKSEGGIIINPLNYEESAKQIRELVNDKDKMKKLGENGRIYIHQNHDWMKVTRDLEKVFDVVVKNK
ncbi:MAG: glycosyltransferase family 4 protein [Thermoplasmata archaeon]